MRYLRISLAKKWTLHPDERDKIILWERVKFTDAHTGKLRERHASFVCHGKDSHRTAIAKTVGLTLGIATRLVLEGKLKHLKGLQIPTKKEIYVPTLKEIKEYDISYQEEEGSDHALVTAN